MTEEKEFPQMTMKQAFDTDTKYYTAMRGACPDCGGSRRWWTMKTSNYVYCYDCIPEGDMLTKCQIGKQERQNKTKIDKLKKKNWIIGTAFGGYNTNK